MSDALRAVCEWAERELAASRIFLRVLDANAHAIAFYERLGFVAEERIPLTRIVDGDRVSLVDAGPGDPVDETFLRMGHAPDRSTDATPILTAGPSISAREASYTLDAVRNGWNGGWNGYIQRFETAFAEYVGAEHAIATSSCTGALHIALAALGIGPGDEVIVPDITWVATANAVSYVGATPVFCDVEQGSWCMSPESFASLITPATKAVMPVALYGHPARLDEIVAIARAHGLRVVEDAAPAHRRRVARPPRRHVRRRRRLQLPGREAPRHRRGRDARDERRPRSTARAHRSGTRAASRAPSGSARRAGSTRSRTSRPRSASARSSAATSSSRPSAGSTAGTPRGSRASRGSSSSTRSRARAASTG